MSIFSQILLSSVSGAVCGAMVFSLFFIIYIYIYIYLYGYFQIGEIGFLGSIYVENPVREGLLAGTIVGGIHGFLTGLFIGISGTISSLKGALAGFIVTESLIFGIYLLISALNDPNPVYLILDLIKNNLYAFLRISIILIIPSTLTGMIVTKITTAFYR